MRRRLAALAWLVSACAPGRAPPGDATGAAAAARAPRPEAGEVPDPPGTRAGVSPFAPLPLLGDGTETVTARVLAWSTSSRGLLEVVQFVRDSGCVLAHPRPGICRFLSFAPWKTPGPASAFRSPPGELGPWSAPRPILGEWSALCPGRDHVHGIRSEWLPGGDGTPVLRVDALDERGVRPVIELREVPGYTGVQLLAIVETAEGLVGYGHGDHPGKGPGDPGLRDDMLALSIEEGEGAGAAKLTAVSRLNLRHVAEQDAVLGAAQRREDGRRLLYETYAASPFLDRDGLPEPSWVLAFKEVLGAAKGSPGPSDAPARYGEVALLTRDHLVRLTRGGQTLAEVTLPPSAAAPRRVSAAPGGVAVNGAWYGPTLALDPARQAADTGASRQAAPPAATVRVTRSQSVRALGFDEPSGEGALLFDEGAELLLQRFDALGERAGDPAVLGPSLASALGAAGGRLLRLGAPVDGWVYVEGASVLALSGPRAPQHVEGQASLPLRPEDTPGPEAQPDAGGAAVLRIVPVWKDAVVVRFPDRADPAGPVHLRWIRAGQSVEAPLASIPGHATPLLPLRDGPSQVIPSTPGLPAPFPPLPEEVPATCKAEVWTGPRRLVLACVERSGDEKRARVGLRVLRY